MGTCYISIMEQSPGLIRITIQQDGTLHHYSQQFFQDNINDHDTWDVCHELSISGRSHYVLQLFLGSGLPGNKYPFTLTGPELLPRLLWQPQYLFSDWNVSNSHTHHADVPHDVLPHRVMCIHVPLHLPGIHMKVT